MLEAAGIGEQETGNFLLLQPRVVRGDRWGLITCKGMPSDGPHLHQEVHLPPDPTGPDGGL